MNRNVPLLSLPLASPREHSVEQASLDTEFDIAAAWETLDELDQFVCYDSSLGSSAIYPAGADLTKV